MTKVTVIDHPLVQHKLSTMRKKETQTGDFRRLLNETSMLLAYEVTRDMPLHQRSIETPIAPMEAPFLKTDEIVFISVLRAGNGILNGMLQIMPGAHVGHIGLYRDPSTHAAIEYYFKVPANMESRDAIVCDPMLATGHSASVAVNRIKSTHPKSLKLLCLLAAPEGIEFFQKEHADVPIYTAHIDEKLNEKKYIVPGIGDAGDRLYGTQ